MYLYEETECYKRAMISESRAREQGCSLYLSCTFSMFLNFSQYRVGGKFIISDFKELTI